MVSTGVSSSMERRLAGRLEPLRTTSVRRLRRPNGRLHRTDNHHRLTAERYPAIHNDSEVIFRYSPKIMKPEGEKLRMVLWFNYWMSTDKTSGKMKYDGGPPNIEEDVLLELMKDGIHKSLFSKSFLRKLYRELQLVLE